MTVGAVAIDVVGNEALATTSVAVSEVSLAGAALANATTAALDEAFAASSLDAVCQVVFASSAAADDAETRGTLVSANDPGSGRGNHDRTSFLWYRR